MKALILIGIGFGIGVYMGAGSVAKEIRSYTSVAVSAVNEKLK